jgi:hypothetical protein
MAVFLNVLNRRESAELNQEEAAELLGVSARTFRRWTRAYEEQARLGFWTAGSARRRANGSRPIAPRKWSGLYRERFQVLRSSISTSIWSRITAPAGATPGSSCTCNGRALFRRRRARGRIAGSASGGRCRG